MLYRFFSITKLKTPKNSVTNVKPILILKQINARMKLETLKNGVITVKPHSAFKNNK